MTRLEDATASEALGAALGPMLRPGDVVALSGPLGAGKTTLARGILRGLGHAGEVPSPTFNIVVAYEPPDVRLTAWHVDLYRIERAGELDELGLDDALADGALIVEWPEQFPGLWPHALQLRIEAETSGARVLTARVPPPWEARWPPR